MAEAIPYKDFREKIKITKEEISKGKHVEIYDGYIYVNWKELESSCERWTY